MLRLKDKAAFGNRWIDLSKIILLLCLFSSCATPKIIKEHIRADNIDGLIGDYHHQKPKHQKVIEQYIFTSHDFSRDSYGDLNRFVNKSENELLRSKFSAIVSSREDSILQVLDGLDDIKSISSYFKTHPDEQTFLKPIVTGTLTQNIADHEYPDVREVYLAFKNTDIADSIYPYYQSKRNMALPQIGTVLEKYCASEMKIFELYRKEGRKSIPQISSNAYGPLIDQLLDNDIPSSPAETRKLFSKITSKHNPLTAIKETIKSEVNGMVKDINECRVDLAKQLLAGPNLSRCKLPTIQIVVKRREVKCPTGDFQEISKMHNKPAPNSKVNTLLSLASFLPGYIGTAASVVDIYKTYKDSKRQAEEVSPYIKKMAKSVFKNFNDACYQEYDESFGKIRKTVIESQEQFKRLIYENY